MNSRTAANAHDHATWAVLWQWWGTRAGTSSAGRSHRTLVVTPVEEHLTGAEEVLIVPHKELFEVPWAALIDAHEHFLIERHVPIYGINRR